MPLSNVGAHRFFLVAGILLAPNQLEYVRPIHDHYIVMDCWARVWSCSFARGLLDSGWMPVPLCITSISINSTPGFSLGLQRRANPLGVIKYQEQIGNGLNDAVRRRPRL